MATLDVAPAASGVATEHYYSIAEAAALLGVSRVTIWRWVRDGRLAVSRLGHRTSRIRHADLDAVLAHQTSASNGRTDDRGVAPRTSWWDVRDTDHLVQFYESDAFLLDAVADYVGAALRAGSPAVVVATPGHQANLEARLRAHGVDVDAAATQGHYLALDAASTLATFMVGDMPDQARFNETIGSIISSVSDGRRSVRVFGEMVALLATQGNAAGAVRLEQLWNDLQAKQSFSLMCGYPLNELGGTLLTRFVGEVCDTHSRIVPTESYTGLDSVDNRLRVIAQLQQKAHTLELEIAERSRVEGELRHKEAELRDFFEQAPVALHWVADDGTIVWANQAELDLLQYSASEYIGQNIAMFYVDEADIDDILQRLSRHEVIREREARMRCKDGSIRHVLISSNVLWQRDKFVHTRCFTVDITRRKQTEQRLAAQYAVTRILSESSTLADAAQPILRCVCDALGWQAGGFWSLDRDAGVLRCHAYWSASDLAGRLEQASIALTFEPGSGLPGRVWASGHPVWVSDVVADQTFVRREQAAVAGLHGAFGLPVRVGGEVVGVMEFFSPEVRTPDSELLAVMAGVGGQVGQFIDRLRAEADRADLLERERAARADLQALLYARDEFLSSAAHDLKNPIANMKAQAQLLERRLARGETLRPEQLARGLASINDSATRMTALVNELLDTARLQLGQPLELNRRSVDLLEIAERVAAEHQHTTQRHRIVVDTDLPTLVGNWDAERLERVLSNLVDNAVKYSPAGDVVISLAEEASDAGTVAVLAVRDSGFGIPSADLPYIFERFRRGANVAGRVGGTGIGLAGVRTFVESHGGTVSVNTTEGVGSTFTVRLPV